MHYVPNSTLLFWLNCKQFFNVKQNAILKHRGQDKMTPAVELCD